MAVITSDFLAGVLTNYRALFQQNFDAAVGAATWRELATPIDSKARFEAYNWLGTTPKMQDVTRGDLIIDDLGKFNFTLENRLWKAGFEVERQEYEDDNNTLGLIRPRIDQLVAEAVRHPGELVFSIFEGNPVAFDGITLFNATRVIGKSANIANTLAGTGVTVAAVQTDLQSAIAAMVKFQDDKGRPMGLRPNAIVVPPNLLQVAFQALNANQGNILNPVLPATETGIITGAGYRLFVNEFATDVNDWYLLCVNPQIRPFIFQNRLNPALEGITNPETESGIIRDRFVYTARARYNVTVSDPRYFVRIVN
jgi:phage major head subunit gpT-like protein